jgi:hypothetical protein
LDLQAALKPRLRSGLDPFEWQHTVRAEASLDLS